MSNLNKQKITPFLWFDDKAEEAMNFYVSAFPNSEITLLKRWPSSTPFPTESTKPGSVQSGSFVLDGVQFYAFDAGPMFRFNSSISFFAVFETDAEVDAVWNKLIEGGEVMIQIDKYKWSDRYGWLNDRFGVSWQLYKGRLKDVGQRISPLLMFSGKQRGKAEEAMNLYMSLFENSLSDGISRYTASDPGPEGLVNHAQFRIMGQTLMVMDNGFENEMPFNEAISLFVNCKDQQEVDYYWDQFTKEGEESRCGWLKDKFGVSWQIVPEFLSDTFETDDPIQIKNVMAAMSQMKKLEVAKLKEAYNQ